MEFQEVVRRRRMVRNYDPDRPVPPEVRERILANALHAPSAGFSQGWAFLVLEEPADIARFWELSAEDPDDPWGKGLRRAPLLIIPMSCKRAYLERYAAPDKGWTDMDESRWPVPYWHIDTGFASLLMLLTAVDEGLGACFFGIPPGDRTTKVKAAFGVPDDYTPIGVVSIGYRAHDKPSPSLKRGRRPVEEVVHRGAWGRH
ncbi:nitroreductase family protein [Thermoactinospora rubra]|uniref:nitroreductase family protein n=1 Tax=Thermoactinospora rubra TaxID=1088767 RepID=UPI000A109282|nr:nitroreductase family protein [Thermoactinospora rubra]